VQKNYLIDVLGFDLRHWQMKVPFCSTRIDTGFSPASPLPRIGHAIRTIPREAARTRRDYGIRTR
jgi:hypothetical protein